MIDSKVGSILYDEGIYHIPEKDKKSEFSFEIHGSESSKVICILNTEEKKYLELLSNIMKAVKLSNGDFCWSLERDWMKIKDKRFDCIFDFGSLETNNLELKKNKFYHIENQNFISTYTLKQLDEDVEKKKILWNELSGKAF